MAVFIKEEPTWTSKSIADTFKLWAKFAPDTPVFIEVNGKEVPIAHLIESNDKIVLYTTPHLEDDPDTRPARNPGRGCLRNS